MTIPTLQVKVCYNEIDFSHEVVRSFSGEHNAAIPCYRKSLLKNAMD